MQELFTSPCNTFAYHLPTGFFGTWFDLQTKNGLVIISSLEVLLLQPEAEIWGLGVRNQSYLSFVGPANQSKQTGGAKYSMKKLKVSE